MQSSASFNGFGECDNPTEAGSGLDKYKPSSTSQLQSETNGSNWFETHTRLAYWLSPGTSSRSCPKGVANYNTPLSNIILIKHITLGAHGIGNAIEYKATFVTDKNYDSALFEAVTGYMPPNFSVFWSLDPKTDTLLRVSEGPGEMPVPVIFSTPDSAYAMGVWSPDLPALGFPHIGYGRWRFSNFKEAGAPTVKWNCVFRVTHPVAGPHEFTCYIFVGTLEDVRSGINKISKELHR